MSEVIQTIMSALFIQDSFKGASVKITKQGPLKTSSETILIPSRLHKHPRRKRDL
jgi:hypothetical protein